eukprot:8060133-Ditylum_brightwellii.AAC.1
MMKRKNANVINNDEKHSSSLLDRGLPNDSQTSQPAEDSKPDDSKVSIKAAVRFFNGRKRPFLCAALAIVLVLLFSAHALSYHRVDQTGSTKKQRLMYTPVPKKSRGIFYGPSHLANLLEPRGYIRTDNEEDAEYVWVHKPSKIKQKQLKPWQRANHLPNSYPLSEKGAFVETMMEYGA